LARSFASAASQRRCRRTAQPTHDVWSFLGWYHSREGPVVIDNLTLLLATGLPLMGSPGPATLSLAGLGVAFGIRDSLPYFLGLATGTIGVLGIVVSGLAGLVLTLPGVMPVVSLLALAYILYLAVRIATAPPPMKGRPAQDRPSFPAGLLLGLSNPKAYAALGAVCSSVVVADDVAVDALTKLVVLSTAVVLINIAWLGFGAAFASVLGDPRWSRAVNLIFAVLLVLSVVAAVLI